MLRNCSEEDFIRFEKSPLFSRIYGDFVCSEKLKNSDGAMFMTDENDLLIEIKNSSLVQIGEPIDEEEFREFLEFVSPNVRMYTEMDITKADGIIMKRNSVGEKKEIIQNGDYRLKDFYNLFCDSGLYSDYQGFMLSVSDAIKTETGFVNGIYIDGELACGAVVTGVTDKTAIITAIATDGNYRRKGLGKKLITEICEKLSGREVFIYREIDKNKEFYENCGFLECGAFVTK